MNDIRSRHRVEALSEFDTEVPSDILDRDSEGVSPADEPDTATLDLRPLGLQLSKPEVDFMANLSPLIPTPRSAKRLVNLYRLVRIGIPDSDLAIFAGTQGDGQYQVVQILLAVLIGSPEVAQSVFQKIMDAPADSDVRAVFAEAVNAHSAEAGLYSHIGTELDRIAKETPSLTLIEKYQTWCPRLARYSFHTRALVRLSTPS